MTTGTNIIDGARAILQDRRTPYRYSDADLLRYLNAAIREMWRVRPDLFAGDLRDAIPQVVEAELGDELPIPLQYTLLVEQFIAGYAELRDDEFTQDGRAVTLLNRFTSQLKGMV